MWSLAREEEEEEGVGGPPCKRGLFPRVFEEKNPPPGASKFRKPALHEVSSPRRCCKTFYKSLAVLSLGVPRAKMLCH